MGLSSLRRHYLGSPTAPTPALPRSYSAADHDAELVDVRRQLRQERDDELSKLVLLHRDETAKLNARIAELEAELAMVSARSTLPPEDDEPKHEPKDDEPKDEPKHEEKHEPSRHRRGR